MRSKPRNSGKGPFWERDLCAHVCRRRKHISFSASNVSAAVKERVLVNCWPLLQSPRKFGSLSSKIPACSRVPLSQFPLQSKMLYLLCFFWILQSLPLMSPLCSAHNPVFRMPPLNIQSDARRKLKSSDCRRRMEPKTLPPWPSVDDECPLFT